ncbi:DMT family transporter [Reinekea thalattae]|uniref:DMT family transporter n=1 Tax=Reinekea thalattae TaxID=2593301 RepID=A0A5C8Z6Y8_9GAMM|nr:DMT family transporter [Reinekea thalattae]TXR53063.1 DMT family transporter [Reinekea thalattae]
MPFAELSGLGAAICWTLSSLLAPRIIGRFGTIRFNTFRITIAGVILVAICLASNRFDALLWQHSSAIILSGIVGIFLGDTFLFSAVHRLGPRRAGVLFTMNAPMSILLGWLFLNEQLSLLQLFACSLVLSGVIIAILFGKQDNPHHWEQTKGRLSVGIMLALGGALGQAVGALLSKPALLAGVDAIAVATLRVATASVALLVAYVLFYLPAIKRRKETTPRPAFWQIPLIDYLGLALMATLGMVIGMSLLVWGIGNAHIGIVTTLSAVVPVLVLPALWLTTGQRPALGAWLGATLLVIGAALIIWH